jgi:menaquinone reductase, multiheme cytochrome c subunit
VKYRGTIFFFAGLFGMLGMGWLGFPRVLYRTSTQPLAFSHKVHTGDKGGMKCEDCHALREDGSFAGIPAVEKCGGCHSQPLTNSAGEKVLVEKFVTPNREVPWLVYARQPENVYFPHAPHVKLAKIKCEECHGPHGATDKLRPYEENRISGYSRDIWGAHIGRVSFGTKRPGMKMDDCTGCHAERGLSHSCLDCHK